MFVDVDATRYGELIHPHEFVEIESNEITSVLHPMYVINSFSFHCSLFIAHCSLLIVHGIDIYHKEHRLLH